jgi:hypothetical protein
LVSASVWGTEGPGFKSRQPDQKPQVANLLHRAGSDPALSMTAKDSGTGAMPVLFTTNAYDEMANDEVTAAKTLADDRPDVAQVHASLAVAYATLAQAAATLAASH